MSAKIVIPGKLFHAKIKHRNARWEMEEAKARMNGLHEAWIDAIAKWLGHKKFIESNVYCSPAPADSNCVYDIQSRFGCDHKCVFCGSLRHDIL